MYSTIIGKINTILESVSKIAEVHSNPVSKMNSYPAAIFFPVSVGNDFETNEENFKTYTFSLFLVCGATQSSVNKIYNEVMPDLVDSVLQAFDTGWDLDSIDGHQVWLKVESGEWNTSVQQDGLIVDSQFNIIIKTLTNN